MKVLATTTKKMVDSKKMNLILSDIEIATA